MENAVKMCEQFCEAVDELIAAEPSLEHQIEVLANLAYFDANEQEVKPVKQNNVLTLDDHDCGGFEEGCQFCFRNQ